MFFLSQNILCAEDETDNPESLSLEFLEFLASFSTEDGKWVDPMEVNEMMDQHNSDSSLTAEKDE